MVICVACNTVGEAVVPVLNAVRAWKCMIYGLG